MNVWTKCIDPCHIHSLNYFTTHLYYIWRINNLIHVFLLLVSLINKKPIACDNSGRRIIPLFIRRGPGSISRAKCLQISYFHLLSYYRSLALRWPTSKGANDTRTFCAKGENSSQITCSLCHHCLTVEI